MSSVPLPAGSGPPPAPDPNAPTAYVAHPGHVCPTYTTVQERLKHIVVSVCGILTELEYDDPNNNLRQAFAAYGISSVADLVTLPNDEIDNLTPDGTTGFPPWMLARLKCFNQFYHRSCADNVPPRNIEIGCFDSNAFGEFRISKYEPGKELVLWGNLVKRDGPISRERENWRKTTKPSKSDYPTFKDELYWKPFYDSFTTTLQSHALEHLVDTSYVPLDPSLDDDQKKWLYAVFDDKFKAPFARKVVQENRDTKDTRIIWKAIQEHYNSSQVAEIRLTTITNYISSADFSDGRFKGGLQSCILHYAEQVRNYNELAEDPLSDSQAVMFLSRAVSLVPCLSEVLNNDKVSRRATAKIMKTPVVPITFEEYLSLLIDKASTYDLAKSPNRNRTGSYRNTRRSVNQMEFIDEEEENSTSDIETNVHDIDTPVECILEANQTDQSGTPRRKAYMDATTWRSISTNDQKAWDTISDSGKKTITTFAAKHPEKYGLQPAGSSLSVRQHESEDTATESSGTIEASTHSIERQITPKQVPTTKDNLKGKTPSDSSVNKKKVNTHGPVSTRRYDINTIMSQKPKTSPPKIEAKVHQSEPIETRRLKSALDIFLDDSSDSDNEGPKLEVMSHNWYLQEDERPSSNARPLSRPLRRTNQPRRLVQMAPPNATTGNVVQATTENDAQATTPPNTGDNTQGATATTQPEPPNQHENNPEPTSTTTPEEPQPTIHTAVPLRQPAPRSTLRNPNWKPPVEKERNQLIDLSTIIPLQDASDTPAFSGAASDPGTTDSNDTDPYDDNRSLKQLFWDTMEGKSLRSVPKTRESDKPVPQVSDPSTHGRVTHANRPLPKDIKKLRPKPIAPPQTPHHGTNATGDSKPSAKKSPPKNEPRPPTKMSPPKSERIHTDTIYGSEPPPGVSNLTVEIKPGEMMPTLSYAMAITSRPTLPTDLGAQHTAGTDEGWTPVASKKHRKRNKKDKADKTPKATPSRAAAFCSYLSPGAKPQSSSDSSYELSTQSGSNGVDPELQSTYPDPSMITVRGDDDPNPLELTDLNDQLRLQEQVGDHTEQGDLSEVDLGVDDQDFSEAGSH